MMNCLHACPHRDQQFDEAVDGVHSALTDHHAEDLRDFVGRLSQSVPLPEPMDHHIHHHRDPQLRLDGVGGRAEERLDVQMLLHPLEQQFDLPVRLRPKSELLYRPSLGL